MYIRIETPVTKQEEYSKESMVPCEGLMQETLQEQTKESPNFPV